MPQGRFSKVRPLRAYNAKERRAYFAKKGEEDISYVARQKQVRRNSEPVKGQDK